MFPPPAWRTGFPQAQRLRGPAVAGLCRLANRCPLCSRSSMRPRQPSSQQYPTDSIGPLFCPRADAGPGCRRGSRRFGDDANADGRRVVVLGWGGEADRVQVQVRRSALRAGQSRPAGAHGEVAPEQERRHGVVRGGLEPFGRDHRSRSSRIVQARTAAGSIASRTTEGVRQPLAMGRRADWRL
jgi:hypothetical protein